MRLSVRFGRRTSTSPEFSWTTQTRLDTPNSGMLLQTLGPISTQSASRVLGKLIRKDNSFQGAGWCLRVRHVLPLVLDPNARILTCFPFGTGDNLDDGGSLPSIVPF